MAKIAVVEDNDTMRAQLCGFIAQYAQESGHQLDVTAFSDGAQLVEPYRPGFDIIFLDIEMPKLGGMPTAERIRRQDPDVVLVFVTNMAQYAIRGYEVDALDFVLKPVSYYQFSTKLERALQRIQDNRVLVLNVYRSVSREQVEQYLYKMLDPLLRMFVERENIPVQEEDKQFIIDFYKYGFVGMVLEWIRRDMKTEPAIMAERLNIMMHGDLKRALMRFSTDGRASKTDD